MRLHEILSSTLIFQGSKLPVGGAARIEDFRMQVPTQSSM